MAAARSAVSGAGGNRAFANYFVDEIHLAMSACHRGFASKSSKSGATYDLEIVVAHARSASDRKDGTNDGRQ